MGSCRVNCKGFGETASTKIRKLDQEIYPYGLCHFCFLSIEQSIFYLFACMCVFFFFFSFEALGPLEVELQSVVSHLSWVLE